MSKYSENEKEVFQTILSDFDLRIDGRNKLELRQYQVEFNTLPSTYSSVRLLYGNNSKEIIFAVKVHNNLYRVILLENQTKSS